MKPWKFAIFLFLLTLFPAIAQAAIRDCSSQGQCYAVLGNESVFLYRETELKGSIDASGNGSGKGQIIFSEGKLVWTRDSNSIVEFLDIETENRCQVSVNDNSCKAGPIIGDMNYTGCDAGIIKSVQIGVCGEEEFIVMDDIDTTCTGPVTSLTSDGTLLYFLCGEDDAIGTLDPSNGAVTTYSMPTGITEMGIANNTLFYRTVGHLYYETLPITEDATALELPQAGGSHLATDSSYVCVDGGTNVSCTNAYYPAAFTTKSIDGSVTDLASNSRTQILSGNTIFLKSINPYIGNPADATVPLAETAHSITSVQPFKDPVCGNGLIEPGESCDGTSFAMGNTCSVLLGNETDTLLLCKSNCKIDFSVCDNFKIDTYVDLDMTGLSPELVDLYEDDTQNLEHVCEVTEDTHGNVAIIAPEGAYCNFAATDSDGQTLIAHLYSNAYLYGRVSVSVDGEINFTSGGHFFVNESHLRLKLNTKVVGTFQQPITLAGPQVLRHEFMGVHPTEAIEGKWLVVKGVQGAIEYCPTSEMNGGPHCGTYIADSETFSFVINLDAEIDFSDIQDFTDGKDDPWWKCQAAPGRSSKTPGIFVLLIMMLIGLVVRRNQHD